MTYSLVSGHSCALLHHLNNRVVGPNNYTKILMFYPGKISYARQNISVLIITRLITIQQLFTEAELNSGGYLASR